MNTKFLIPAVFLLLPIINSAGYIQQSDEDQFNEVFKLWESPPSLKWCGNLNTAELPSNNNDEKPACHQNYANRNIALRHLILSHFHCDHFISNRKQPQEVINLKEANVRFNSPKKHNEPQ